MILVAGATGLVGNEVCQKLARRGEKVRALVRATSAKEKLGTLRSCGAELCVGDLKDPGSLSSACRGVDAVISTASSTFSRQAGDSIESVDAAGQLNLVNAAQAAGIGRFVFVSFRRPRGHVVPAGRCETHRRRGHSKPELHDYSSELVHGGVAEPRAGVRLPQRGGAHLWTRYEPDQLGFVPGCRRNVRPPRSGPGRGPPDDRVRRTRGPQPPGGCGPLRKTRRKTVPARACFRAGTACTIRGSGGSDAEDLCSADAWLSVWRRDGH